MRNGPRNTAAVSALAALVCATAGRAEPVSSSQSAHAEFDYGLAEMLAGRYATGCPAISASYEVAPLPGTLFTLAECENRWSKLASALAHYNAYLMFVDRMTPGERAQQAERQALAIRQRNALTQAVPKLTIEL